MSSADHPDGAEQDLQQLAVHSEGSAVVLQAEEKNSHVAEVDADITPKRKRGRPPKLKVHGELTTASNPTLSDSHSLTTPKQRGRPRKTELKDIGTKEPHPEKAEVSVRRGRGRPRKDCSSRFQQADKEDTTHNITGSFSSPMDSNVSGSQKHHVDDSEHLHSTPISAPAFALDAVESPFPDPSPIAGRRSGRPRKKPFKFMDLEERSEKKRRRTESAESVSEKKPEENLTNLSKQTQDRNVSPGTVLMPRSDKVCGELNENQERSCRPQTQMLSGSRTSVDVDSERDMGPPVVKKRGRGRPRKEQTMAERCSEPHGASEIPDNTSLASTPRGDKVCEDVDDSLGRSHREQIVSGSRTGVDMDSEQDTGPPVVKKRGRGRPRKEDGAGGRRSESQSCPETPDNMKSRLASTPRGDKACEDVNDSLERSHSEQIVSGSRTSVDMDSEQDTGPPAVKKRGRGQTPRSEKRGRGQQRKEDGAGGRLSESQSCPETPENTTSKLASTPRGDKVCEDVDDSIGRSHMERILSGSRTSVSVDSKQDTEQPAMKKRGRGRPPLLEQKRRGRPRKEDGAAVKRSQSESFPETCLRCGEKMASLYEYKQHLVTKHAALYRKACPEGEQTFKAWQDIIKTMKRILCPTCQKPFRFAQYFKHHLEWCGREDEKKECEQCGRMVKAMWFYQHIRDHRKRERDEELKREREEQEKSTEQAAENEASETKRRKAAAMSLQRIKEVTEKQLGEVDGKQTNKKKSGKNDMDWSSGGENLDDDFDDDEEDDDEEEENDLDRTDLTRNSSRRPKKHEDGSYSKLITFARPPRMDFFKEHECYLEEHPTEQLHPSLMPLRCDWVILSESESSRYLPVSRDSVPFKITAGDNSQTQPTSLQWGKTVSNDRQATAFVGGPVNAVEWCPLDAEVSGRGQVLAVSAGRIMWEDWKLFDRGEGPGLIQFWTTGPLDSRQSDCVPDLKLAFAVAHNARHVLSMSWCPAGVYEDQQPKHEENLQRLGLLAVAGFDSNAYLYSIPTPESLPAHKKENKETPTPPIFKPTPTLTLLCGNDEVCGACLSVSWQKGDGCDYIAGGYAKGFVNLWHVSNTSPSVRQDHNTLAPVRYFFDHEGPVFCVDWSWLDVTHFATGGMDDKVNVWDCKSLRFPLLTYPDSVVKEKGPVRAVAYGSAALDGIVYADDQRDQNSGSVSGVDLSEGFPRGPYGWMAHVTVDRHAATVWDISYSAWFNLVASCDSTGLLSVASCWPLHFMRHKLATKSRKGVPVFSTTCTLLESVQNGNQSTVEEHAAYDGMTFTDADNLQITFEDSPLKNKKDFVRTGEETTISRQLLGELQPADTTATSFNPNKASSMWLAAGTRAGFLRLLHLPGLSFVFPTSKKFFTR